MTHLTSRNVCARVLKSYCDVGRMVWMADFRHL